MKHCLRVLSFFGLICLATSLQAQGSWESVFRALIDEATGSTLIESGRVYTGSFYSARLRFIITDGDGNSNNFANPDSIDFQILNTDLRYTGDKPGLTKFAEANGTAIFNAIFPRDVAGEVGGISDTQMTSGTFFSGILSSDSASPQESKDEKKLEAAPTSTQSSIHGILTRMEFSFITVGENEQDVTSMMGTPSYSAHFGDYLQHSVGILIPIRYAKKDDRMDSELLTATFSPFFKYQLFHADSLWIEEDSLSVDVGIHGILHTTFISSTLFGGAGHLRYGGSIFAAAQWKPLDYLSLRLGMAYQISKADVPSFIGDKLVSDDFQWLVETIKDLPLDHELSFGLRISVPVMDTLTISLDYQRSNSLGKRATAETAFMSHLSVVVDYLLADFLDISLGYRTAFELENYEEHTILAGGLLNF